jgi:hypothetical protein
MTLVAMGVGSKGAHGERPVDKPRYRETLPSEMSLEEILGAGIAEHAARAKVAEARIAELEAELARAKALDSEPPSGIDLKTSGGNRVRGERTTTVVVMLLVAVTALLWRLPDILAALCD